MSYKFISLQSANDGKHKYIVVLLNTKTGRHNSIKFGDYGMEDYTTHRDLKRKKLYESRHIVREDWNNPGTAGFWSKWLLWNKPSIGASLKDTIQQFNL